MRTQRTAYTGQRPEKPDSNRKREPHPVNGDICDGGRGSPNSSFSAYSMVFAPQTDGGS
jgi:hypothetical protein